MPHVPTKLGPFEPRYRLGAGGMAETFVAVRRGPAGFEQRVCLKRILPAYAGDAEFVRAFLAEARTSATLRHANIVQVLDFGHAAGSHYLALELIDGLDLRALMQREAQLDAELVTLIASEIGYALEHAHEGAARVVHRDISPSNVLVSRAGEIKLTDFGIARVLGGTHHTASGVIKGKAPYMPPEYISGGHFDVRGDLFAVGVLLFELLHRQRPFDGDSELDTLRRIVAGERRPFTADAPPELVACIERLLATRPQDRFASARELLDALPPVALNAARKRLSELVRARTPSPEVALARASSLPLDPTLTLTSDVPDTEVDPSRTSARPRGLRSRMPSKPALLALGCSLAMFGAVAAMGLWRIDSHAADAASHAADAAQSPEPGSPPPRTAILTRATSREGPSPSPSSRAPAPEPVRPTAAPAPVTAAAPAGAAPSPAPQVTAQAAAPGSTAPAATSASPSHTGVAPAELRVVAYPFGDVWVDDKFLGASPLTVRVGPGTHSIAVGEGRPRERRSIELRAGEHSRIIFGDPPPAAADPR